MTQVESNAEDNVAVLLVKIVKQLKSMAKVNEEEARKQNVMSGWQDVMALVDRLLLFLFLGCVAAVSIWFMTLSPSTE